MAAFFLLPAVTAVSSSLSTFRISEGVKCPSYWDVILIRNVGRYLDVPGPHLQLFLFHVFVSETH